MFFFSSEYHYIGVSEYDERERNKWKAILPPEDQRLKISSEQ